MSLLCLFLQGVLYDLFECLYSYMDNANLTSIPIYFISPVADSSLAYANIYAEWYAAKSYLGLSSRFSIWSNQKFHNDYKVNNALTFFIDFSSTKTICWHYWFFCSLSVNVRATLNARLRWCYTRDDSQRQFLVQNSVAILGRCCSNSKQCRNNVATLCWSENRRCESSRVTSFLRFPDISRHSGWC